MSNAPLPANIDHAAIAPADLFKMSQADIEALPPAVLIAVIESLPPELAAQWDARDTRSQNTSAQYKRGQDRFAAWMDQTGQALSYPVAPRIVAAFVDAMGREGAREDGKPYAPATIENYLHAINDAHRVRDLALPASANVVRQAVKRMKRNAANNGRGAQKQATPMQWDAVSSALNKMGDSLIDLRDAALIALAYDTLARASELVGLNVGDVCPQGDAAVAFIAKSKTDQEGKGAYAPVPRDTFDRVLAWVDAAGLEPSDPLFVPLSTVAESTADRISPRDVARIFKRRVGESYSAHSTRVGCAVDQKNAGITTDEIRQSGRWVSPAMVDLYTQRYDVSKGGAAKLAKMQGRA